LDACRAKKDEEPPEGGLRFRGDYAVEHRFVLYKLAGVGFFSASLDSVAKAGLVFEHSVNGSRLGEQATASLNGDAGDH
jgi:hypothetical protein